MNNDFFNGTEEGTSVRCCNSQYKDTTSINQNVNASTAESNFISLSGPDVPSYYNLPVDCNQINTNLLSGKDSEVIILKNGRYSLYDGNFSDWPNVLNNTLVFKDDTHFFTYLKYLEYVINIASKDQISKSQDDLLEDVEGAIGFLSLRKVTEDDFQKLNQFGWNKLENIPERHFIPDLITKSYLNTECVVIVGDKLMRYVNENYLVTVSTSNSKVISELLNLSIHSDFNQVNSLYKYVGRNEYFHISLLRELSLISESVNNFNGKPTFLVDNSNYIINRNTNFNSNFDWNFPVHSGGDVPYRNEGDVGTYVPPKATN